MVEANVHHTIIQPTGRRLTRKSDNVHHILRAYPAILLLRTEDSVMDDAERSFTLLESSEEYEGEDKERDVRVYQECSEA